MLPPTSCIDNCQISSWGRVEIKRWSQFHFYHSADHPLEIILIQRQGKGISLKAAKPMWLAWIGLEKLSLESLWQHYLRRFAIEHCHRFVKQRLHWRATPRLSRIHLRISTGDANGAFKHLN